MEVNQQLQALVPGWVPATVRIPLRVFVLQWGLSRDGELLKKYSQKPYFQVSVDINFG